MNQYIERLAKEADDYADEQTQSKGELHPNWGEVRDAKFAALVAEECAKVADEHEAWRDNPAPVIAADIRAKFAVSSDKPEAK